MEMVTDEDEIRTFLGRCMNFNERKAKFPSDSYGINTEGDTVISLKVIMAKGKDSGYINYFIDANTVCFSKSPNENANNLLKKTKTGIPLHVVYNGEDFDFGKVIVKDILNPSSSGTWWFVLQREESTEESATPPEETETIPLAKKQKTSPPKIFENTFKGHSYDSLLEVQHAAFFDCLGLPYMPHSATYTLRSGDIEMHYTPDFFLPTVGDRGTIIEIKPQYPHEEELIKAELLSFTMKVTVVLLYGSFSAGPPFQNEHRDNVTGKVCRHYTHSNSVRGILWDPDSTKKIEGVTWGIDNGEFCFIYRNSFRDMRWNSEILEKAYIHASKSKSSSRM